MPARSIRCHLPVLLALGVAGCGHSNGIAVRAQVASIDRTCAYKQIIGEYKGRPVTGGSGTREMLPCDTTDDFAKLREHPGKRSKNIVGTATVTVAFDSPVDRSMRTATLQLDGGDDAFYALRYGDTVDLMVDKADMTKVSLAEG